jgi:hypothetical protein
MPQQTSIVCPEGGNSRSWIRVREIWATSGPGRKNGLERRTNDDGVVASDGASDSRERPSPNSTTKRARPNSTDLTMTRTPDLDFEQPMTVQIKTSRLRSRRQGPTVIDDSVGHTLEDIGLVITGGYSAVVRGGAGSLRLHQRGTMS